MGDSERLRVASYSGILGGLAWFILFMLIEVVAPPLARTRGTLHFTATFLTGAVALVLLLIGFLGILWGDGVRSRFGRIAVWLTVLGYVLMILGSLLTLAGAGPLTDPAGGVSFVYIAGRMLTVLFTLLTSIAVIVDRRWQGWARFVPLLLFLCMAVEFLPVFSGGSGPNGTFTALWGLCSALLGLATLVEVPRAGVREAVL